MEPSTVASQLVDSTVLLGIIRLGSGNGLHHMLESRVQYAKPLKLLNNITAQNRRWNRERTLLF